MTARKIGPFLVAILLTGVLVGISYMVFFVPQQNKAAALKADTANAKVTNDVLGEKVDLIRQKRDNLPALEGQVAEFNTAFPAGASQEDLFKSILGAAGQAGVSVTTLNPGEPQTVAAGTEGDAAEGMTATDEGAPTPEKGPVATTAISISANGSVEGLQKFVANLEAMKRPVSIKEFLIEPAGDEESRLTVVANSFFVAPLTKPALDAEPAPAEEAPAEETAG